MKYDQHQSNNLKNAYQEIVKKKFKAPESIGVSYLTDKDESLQRF